MCFLILTSHRKKSECFFSDALFTNSLNGRVLSTWSTWQVWRFTTLCICVFTSITVRTYWLFVALKSCVTLRVGLIKCSILKKSTNLCVHVSLLVGKVLVKEIHLWHRGHVNLHLPVSSFFSKIVNCPLLQAGTQRHASENSRSTLQGWQTRGDTSVFLTDFKLTCLRSKS